MRKTLLTIIVLTIIVILGAAIYLIRPPKSASENIQTNTEVLTPENTPNSNLALYRISQDASKVEFDINEVLGGEDFTVVGQTNQVAGDVLVNKNDIEKSEVGTIRINARTLKTDNPNRDGAISRVILKSEQDQFEFIEFKPTQIVKIPESSTEDQIAIKITGNLTIAGTTKEITFDGTVDLSSDEKITVSAQTTILYKDFDLTIPEVPFVASVENQVILKASLTAIRIPE